MYYSKGVRINYILFWAFFILVVDGALSPSLSFARRERVITTVTISLPGRNMPLEDWELEWVRSQTAAIYPKRNYVVWLKNVRQIVNSEGGNRTIFYPGVGPYIGFDEVDLVSPLLATGYTRLIAIDKQHLSFAKFKETAEKILSFVKGVQSVEVKQLGEEKYQLGFTFEGKKRSVTVYYGKDGNYFFPEELKKGYDGIYTRWMTTVFDPTLDRQAQDTRAEWLKFLNPSQGFIITDNEYPYFDRVKTGFWTHFVEIPLDEIIPITVIANAFKVHLLLRSDNRVKFNLKTGQ